MMIMIIMIIKQTPTHIYIYGEHVHKHTHSCICIACVRKDLLPFQLYNATLPAPRRRSCMFNSKRFTYSRIVYRVKHCGDELDVAGKGLLADGICKAKGREAI